MEPHWVNIIEREPELNKEVHVLVVRLESDIGYARAKATKRGWVFVTKPISTRIVAWLESDRLLGEDEVQNIPKGGLKF